MDALIGSYRLLDWVFTLDGAGSRRPFGGDATGLLTYTADGRMWATLMRSDREPLGVASIMAASEADRARAAAGYLSYAGTWTVEGDEVVHHVEVSLLPDWVGEDQRRRFRLDGDVLVLETPDMITSEGKRARNTLRWKRIGEDG